MSKRKIPSSSTSNKKVKVDQNKDQKLEELKYIECEKGCNWESVHDDIEKGNYSGVYGGNNSAWHGLAGIRAGVKMSDWHKKRSPDEFYHPSLVKLLKLKSTRKRWNQIVAIDPMGMYSNPPTMSCTTAHMTIPELTLKSDGKIVNEDGSVNVLKCAVDYAWNLKNLSRRMGLPEKEVRKELYEHTKNKDVLDEKRNTYLPPVGGCTVYFFGDVSKLDNPDTEVAVRVHDSCCGSDVFGTDICTCRPYLTFSIDCCVSAAKRGGVGIIVYFQKEGRSLGEVIKFRVYNARKAQEGGDRPETYFKHTESIAGIRDARFQEVMPDILTWLGIERIDWLMSMSSEKYEAITGAGIKVMQRVSLPDIHVPKGASVELTAKISAGYHADSIESGEIITQLRTLPMIRERCGQVFDLAKKGQGRYFDLDLSKMDETVDFVQQVTKDAYPDLDAIPYHSRWRHFDEKETEKMTKAWPCDKIESVRRLMDLACISVLLDAGAGSTWKYIDSKGQSQTRSEGLAIASYDMFCDGIFSSDVCVPHRVNSVGLKNLALKTLQKGFQVHPENNPVVGLEGRHGLLKRLGEALEKNPEFFGKEVCRPGNMVDYVLAHVKDKRVSIKVLWKAVIEGFESIWPRNLSGVRRGDVWTYSPLLKIGVPASDMIPFHKLSQWLTYSLLEPIESLGIKFDDMDLLTGLAEYRNGGLFVDMGVLTPKFNVKKKFDTGSELIVEWRALTLCLLDELAVRFRKKLNKTKEELPLAKILQGGTWTAGRLIAAKKREDKSPPIDVISNGTVF